MENTFHLSQIQTTNNMKRNIKNTLYTGLTVASSVLAMVSCSDTWDEHYTGEGSAAGKETLMQQIEKNAPDFAKVVKAVKFDKELEADNSYTVWAPQHINVDSLLTLAKTDSAGVVNGFIKNHIARYAVSMNGSEQRVSLVNNKFSLFNKDKFASSDLVKTNITCKNGILHVIDNSNPYLMNLFEMLKSQYVNSNYAYKDSVGGSLYTFLRKYDADSLDLEKSVSRGYDEYGEPIWVDSVIIRNNTALKNVGALIYEEDSNYVAILPTPEAYHKRFLEYKELFKFNKSLEESDPGACDSLANHYSNMYAMNDLFYNMTNNEHFEDSLKSTTYSYGKIGVYYRKDNKNQLKPTHDILAGLNDVECSNGTAYPVDEYPISIFEQGHYQLAIPFSPYYMAKNKDTGNSDFTTNINKDISSARAVLTEFYYTEQDSVIVDEETGEKKTIKVYDRKKYANEKRGFFYYYPKLKAGSNTYLSFFIPDYLSGTYDISIVTVPMWVYNALTLDEPWTPSGTAPTFQAAIFERKANGQYPTRSKPTYQIVNEQFKDNASSKNNFIPSNQCVMDTTYLGEYTFENTYYGRGTTEETCGAMLHIKMKPKEPDLLLSRIILTPKPTKKEETGN